MTQEIETIAIVEKIAAEARAELLLQREIVRAKMVELGWASKQIDAVLYYQFDLNPSTTALSEKIYAFERWAANKRRSAGDARCPT